MMTRIELIEIGEALYGTRWQSALSSALGTNARSLRRWLSGQNEIPDSVETDIRALLEIKTRRRPLPRNEEPQ
jgi:hypothetical protein